MKKSATLISRGLVVLALTALTSVGLAEAKVTLSDVHLCCGACQKGVERAVSKVSGASVDVDRKAGSAVVSAGDAATAQKALDAIAKAGYYGKSDNAKLAIKGDRVGNGKASNVSVSGVHLCCGKCVKAIDDIVADVSGATGHDAKKGSKNFTISGTYDKQALVNAFHKHGLNASVK